MATNRQTHQIGKIKKLIDLNGDTTNFDITFQVVSRNKEPFDLLVVDQTTLDNSQNLEYKKVEKGMISGNIVQDKNVYQNYFLILRAENPCECDIEITKKELPKTQPVPSPAQQKLPVASDLGSPKKSDGFSWVKILLIVGAIAALGIGFYLYSKKSGVDQKETNAPVEAGFKFYSPPKSSHSHESPKVFAKDVGASQGNKLLERLKRLNLN